MTRGRASKVDQMCLYRILRVRSMRYESVAGVDETFAKNRVCLEVKKKKSAALLVHKWFLPSPPRTHMLFFCVSIRSIARVSVVLHLSGRVEGTARYRATLRLRTTTTALVSQPCS